MKHLLTSIVCCLAVAGSAQTWNPDADFDNVIGVNDLMALLSVFGSEWTEVYPLDPTYELAAYYEDDLDWFECVRACHSNGARIIGLFEYAIFEDSVIATVGNNQHFWMQNEHIYGTGKRETYNWNEFQVSGPTSNNFDISLSSWAVYPCICTGLVPAVE